MMESGAVQVGGSKEKLHSLYGMNWKPHSKKIKSSLLSFLMSALNNNYQEILDRNTNIMNRPTMEPFVSGQVIFIAMLNTLAGTESKKYYITQFWCNSGNQIQLAKLGLVFHNQFEAEAKCKSIIGLPLGGNPEETIGEIETIEFQGVIYQTDQNYLFSMDEKNWSYAKLVRINIDNTPSVNVIDRPFLTSYQEWRYIKEIPKSDNMGTITPVPTKLIDNAAYMFNCHSGNNSWLSFNRLGFYESSQDAFFNERDGGDESAKACECSDIRLMTLASGLVLTKPDNSTPCNIVSTPVYTEKEMSGTLATILDDQVSPLGTLNGTLSTMPEGSISYVPDLKHTAMHLQNLDGLLGYAQSEFGIFDTKLNQPLK
jgi:hypothetical protein